CGKRDRAEERPLQPVRLVLYLRVRRKEHVADNRGELQDGQSHQLIGAAVKAESGCAQLPPDYKIITGQSRVVGKAAQCHPGAKVKELLGLTTSQTRPHGMGLCGVV